MNKANKRTLKKASDRIAARADEALRAADPRINAMSGKITEALSRSFRILFRNVDASESLGPSDRAKLRAIAGSLNEAQAHGLEVGSILRDQAKHMTDVAIRGVYDSVAAAAGVGANAKPVVLEGPDIFRSVRKLLWKRYEKSAERYSGAIGDRIRSMFRHGVEQRWTWSKIALRLSNDPGMRRVGDLSAGANRIAEGAGRVYRFWSERLMRTEGIHALNTAHYDATRRANAMDPGYVNKWNSSNDKRGCPQCASLDEAIAATGREFRSKGGTTALYPPLHPMCRCVVVAWRREWD